MISPVQWSKFSLVRYFPILTLPLVYQLSWIEWYRNSCCNRREMSRYSKCESTNSNWSLCHCRNETFCLVVMAGLDIATKWKLHIFNVEFPKFGLWTVGCTLCFLICIAGHMSHATKFVVFLVVLEHDSTCSMSYIFCSAPTFRSGHFHSVYQLFVSGILNRFGLVRCKRVSPPMMSSKFGFFSWQFFEPANLRMNAALRRTTAYHDFPLPWQRQHLAFIICHNRERLSLRKTGEARV